MGFRGGRSAAVRAAGGAKPVLPFPPEPCGLFQRLLDFLNAFSQCIENSNPPGRVGILGLCTCQYDRTRPVIQVVDVDDLRARILNVRYREANTLRRLKRFNEADNRDGKCNRHLNADRRRSVVSLGLPSYASPRWERSIFQTEPFSQAFTGRPLPRRSPAERHSTERKRTASRKSAAT